MVTMLRGQEQGYKRLEEGNASRRKRCRHFRELVGHKLLTAFRRFYMVGVLCLLIAAIYFYTMGNANLDFLTHATRGSAHHKQQKQVPPKQQQTIAEYEDKSTAADMDVELGRQMTGEMQKEGEDLSALADKGEEGKSKGEPEAEDTHIRKTQEEPEKSAEIHKAEQKTQDKEAEGKAEGTSGVHTTLEEKEEDNQIEAGVSMNKSPEKRRNEKAKNKEGGKESGNAESQTTKVEDSGNQDVSMAKSEAKAKEKVNDTSTEGVAQKDEDKMAEDKENSPNAETKTDKTLEKGSASKADEEVGKMEKANEQGSNAGVISPSYSAEADIHMWQAYEEIPFTPKDASEDISKREAHSWEHQGFPISYNKDEVLKEPILEVVVMPHSHNDPGWLQTFEDYYQTTTTSILSNAHKFLEQKPDASFEWAELSFLELWWRNHPAEEREAFKKVVESGQLEILTGGWVMSDEANSHYFATIMQLLEGHEWLRNHLLVGPSAAAPPVSHWSIDPFGLSPTFAYLLHEAGLKQGVIQRTHYAVKAHLAARRQLEFRWRQAWAGASNTTDFLTHMMPFHIYAVPFTCGPDPDVCCQFDFANLGERCFGGRNKVMAISESNVAEKAELLADQFRKKAQLFKENVILVPWGADFTYVTEEEWSAQYGNLHPIFDYINSHSEEYNMHVKFGTLKNYFGILRERLSLRRETLEASKEAQEPEAQLPTLSGDFFTYADRSDHYWSGYFTSRPFHKHMDRTLQHYLRTADILFTVATNHRPHGGGSRNPEENEELVADAEERKDESMAELLYLYPRLVEARRALGVFQHHDGVTGTAKDFVMQDYALKMIAAINTSTAIITQATELLFNAAAASSNTEKNSEPATRARRSAAKNNSTNNKKKEEESPVPRANIIHLTLDQEFTAEVAIPHKRVIPPRSEVILFNPLGHTRKEVVCVLIPASNATEKPGKNGKGDGSGELLMHQASMGDEHLNGNTGDGDQQGTHKAIGESGTIRWTPLRQQQTQPIVMVENGALTLPSDKRKLCFLAQIPALGFRRYYLDYAAKGEAVIDVEDSQKGENDEGKEGDFRVKLLLKGEVNTTAGGANAFVSQKVDPASSAQKTLFTISNDRLSLSFNPTTGFLTQLSATGDGADDEESVMLELSFELYRPIPREGARAAGAYTFMPDGPAKPLPNSANNTYVLIDGPVQKSLLVKLGEPYHLLHIIELDVHSDALTIRNLIEISNHKNVEVAMRLKTAPELADFYTELNAYQYIRRRRHFDKLPIQAHVFPMPGAAFIQGEGRRLSLLGRQALGTASLEPGWMEVVLDRRLSTDDGYGLGQFLQDNRLTESRFNLVVEKFAAGAEKMSKQASEEADTAYNSLRAHRLALELQYPTVIQYMEGPSPITELPTAQSLLGGQLPCGVHMVALRTLSEPTQYEGETQSNDDSLVDFFSLTTEPQHAAALILHRTGIECDILHGADECENSEDSTPDETGSIEVKSLFSAENAIAQPKRVAEASLTLLKVIDPEKEGGNVSELRLGPMEIKTWKLEF